MYLFGKYLPLSSCATGNSDKNRGQQERSKLYVAPLARDLDSRATRSSPQFRIFYDNINSPPLQHS